jgi:molybdenum cofactor cytidylyltransferase
MRMSIVGIVLAAGAASRMGRNKLLLDLEGEPLLRRTTRRALEAGLDGVLVVLGHEADEARAALASLPCTPVLNPAWAEGMNTSLSAGVAALPPGSEAAVLLLADMPFVDSSMIRAVVDRWRETGAPVVASRYGAVPAPPTLYARVLFEALQGGAGDGRGRQVVKAQGDRALFVDWPPSALADLDEPEDVERARSALPRSGA